MKNLSSLFLGILLVFILICGVVYVGMRVFGVEPFEPYLCLNPAPSEAQVIEAMRGGDGNGVEAMIDDNLTLQVQQLDCPHVIGVGDPKMVLHLYVVSNNMVITEGELYVTLIDEQVVGMTYTPTTPIPTVLRQHYPSLQAFLERYSTQ